MVLVAKLPRARSHRVGFGCLHNKQLQYQLNCQGQA